MRKLLFLTAALLLCASLSYAVKQHVVTFGKLMPVKLFLGPSEDRVVDMQVRSLFIDGKLKDFTTGDTHDITDTVFVVRRAFRVNDSLPTEPRKAPKWMWQRGGWLEPAAGQLYAPWQVRYVTDGTLQFASSGWFDARGSKLEPPRTLQPSSKVRIVNPTRPSPFAG